MAEEFDKPFWEDHYRKGGGGHGDEPNPSLVREAADLPPGRALDAGCGHGADARWLASRGWQVTAVDTSATVLAEARTQADITWVEADLASWSPGERCFDLVTSHYVHVPAGSREAFVRRLADAVAPGGTLLLVGHDSQHVGAHGTSAEAYTTPQDSAALLDPTAWDVLLVETRTRLAAHGDTLHDAILKARRRLS